MASANTLTRIEAIERARVLSEVSYDVALDLTGDDRTYRSETKARFRCAEPGASAFIDLVASQVESAELNGRLLPADAFDGARIRLDSLAAENELRVVARCSFTTTGQGLHRMVDPVDGLVYTRTHFEPFDAHQVFACFDQPDLRAPFSLAVTVPDGWIAVSNGRESSRDDGVFVFEPTPPIPTYLTVLCAGPYHGEHAQHGDLPMALYCRQSMKPYLDADHWFGLTRTGLDFYGALFDVPYPFSKYDQAFVPEQGGAMEQVGCVTFGDGFLYRSKLTAEIIEGRADVLFHEMAHMWFGDLVTMRWWDDLWLKESFATYMATLTLSEAAGFEHAWLHFSNGTKSMAYQADERPTTHPIAADIPDTDALRVNYDAITYNKGASVLAQLGTWVGRDAFVAGVREFFRRHAWGASDLREFLGALGEASGRPVDEWSRAWLESAGLNTLTPEVAIDSDRYTRVTIVQSAPVGDAVLRPHRLAVATYSKRGDRLERTERVELDVDGERTDVKELAGAPVADLLLVNDGDLGYARVALDERSLATLRNDLSSLDDPLARCLCWSAAWHMVREGTLPARQYRALVERHAGREEDLELLGLLLGQGLSTVVLYGDPANAAAARASLEPVILRLLAEAEPGSDRQLTVVRAWIGLTHDGAALRGLLEGAAPREGLEIDVDLRFSLLGALARAGDLSDEEIAAELDRDPTDIGRRRVAYLRGARPLAAAKAEAWDQAIHNRELDLPTRGMIGGSVFQRDQEELVFPYLERFAEAIPALWAEEELTVALRLTAALTPSNQLLPETVEVLDRLLAGDLPVPARRILLDAQEGVRRGLRGRGVDAAAG